MRGRDSGELREVHPLPPRAQAVAEARELTRTALLSWRLEHLVDLATLVVSELVTNALTHARSEMTLELTRRPDLLRVSVTDASPDSPRRRRADPAAEGGRGMHMVAELASRWGIEQLPSGKRVWAEIVIEPTGPEG
jgi:anti-sigma regulatory factor (Ser/Thr protein kinase)